MSYSIENLYNLSEICGIKRAYCNFPELSLYNIFPADFKPIPVKVETTVSFCLFFLRYFFNPAMVAEEVGSMK